jgi:uncharacterized lipoprotein YmbA
MKSRFSDLCLLASVLGLFSACSLPQPQADLARHFTLSGPVTGTPVPDAVTVHPVRLAGHLRNRAMAVRIAPNEVTYLEDVRWAEALDDAITQVLRARLAGIGGGAQVSVQIQRCELVRNEGNTVQLAATYAISPSGADKSEARRGSFTANPRPWDGKDYGELVGLLRDAVGDLGDALATAVAGK